MLRGWCILSDVICFFFFFALIQERPFAGYSVLLSVCSSGACLVLKNSTWDAFCGNTLVVCPAGNSAVQCNIYCLINFDNEYHSYERR